MRSSVNLDVIATTPDGLVYPTFISRRLAGGGWASNDSGPDVAPPGIDVALARGAPGVGARGSARRLQTSDLCYPVTTKIGDTNAYMVYGELHTGYNESAWFRYGQDADSAVGVGLSYSSPTGPWSVSGSVQIGNARGAYEQWNEGASWGHQLKSNFHYSKYQTLGCGSYWSVKATQWNSGMVLGVDNHANDFKCLSTYSAYSAGYYPNTDFQRSSSNFVNWSGAVSAFGASLTAKSGASTWVIAHWHFGSTYSKYWLCGTDNFPPYAHRIFAGG